METQSLATANGISVTASTSSTELVVSIKLPPSWVKEKQEQHPDLDPNQIEDVMQQEQQEQHPHSNEIEDDLDDETSRAMYLSFEDREANFLRNFKRHVEKYTKRHYKKITKKGIEVMIESMRSLAISSAFLNTKFLEVIEKEPLLNPNSIDWDMFTEYVRAMVVELGRGIGPLGSNMMGRSEREKVGLFCEYWIWMNCYSHWHWAVWMEDCFMVETLFRVDPQARGLLDSHGRLECISPLHAAVFVGNERIVSQLIGMRERWRKKESSRNPTYLKMAIYGDRVNALRQLLKEGENVHINDKNDWSETPLHVVANVNAINIFKEMKNVEELSWNEEDTWGRTALEIAHSNGHHTLQKLLMEVEPVRSYVESLYRDRQVFVDAANAILVGAALIASVTFASWLQPPLGLDQLDAHVHVEHNPGLHAFWICNSLAFYFAIATVVNGARSVLPRRLFIRVMVEKIRRNLFFTSIFLAFSVMFVVIAFAIAGSIVLAPILKFQANMIATSIIGGGVCSISLILLLQSIWEDYQKPVVEGEDP